MLRDAALPLRGAGRNIPSRHIFVLSFQQLDKLEAKISCKRRKNPFARKMGSLGAALGPRDAVGSQSSPWEPPPLLHRRKDGKWFILAMWTWSTIYDGGICHTRSKATTFSSKRALGVPEVCCDQGWWLSSAADPMSDNRHMIIKQIHKKIPFTPSPLAFTQDAGCVPSLAQLSPWQQMDVAVPSPFRILGRAGGRQMAMEGKRVQILLSGKNCRNP